MITTNETLLERLKRIDAHDAWKEFFDAYAASIVRFGCKLGLTNTQARDVLQEAMVDLMRIIPRFEYDVGKGRFRNFLLTIVHRRSLACLRRSNRIRKEPWDDALHGRLNSIEPPEALADEKAQKKWKEAIRDEVISTLQSDPRVGPRTWAVFEAYVLENRSSSEVAKAFGMNENAVYQIKNRMLRRIRTEVARKLIEAGSIDGEDV